MGIYLVGNCPGGELSSRRVVLVGKSSGGSCPDGECLVGTCPSGELF